MSENAKRTDRVEKILVAMDFDETSARALDTAVNLARALGAEITLLHVWDIPPYPHASMASAALHRAVEESERDAFDALLADAKTREPKVTGLLKQGIAWREILAVADETHADLLILGRHGRLSLPRALLGSVAEKVVRMSPIPVLMVPGPRS